MAGDTPPGLVAAREPRLAEITAYPLTQIADGHTASTAGHVRGTLVNSVNQPTTH
ncbi:hypothetical protein ACIGFK_18780 [Streptomyces sp. NPDC085524]|uniref:hypothetical protein n=1 Tax=unclassified Streptomyces TaxID=2593676 RepID=UPI0035E16F1B